MHEAKKILSNSMIVILAALLGGAFAYIFNMLVGRLLGPKVYGEFTTLMSVMAIFSVAAGAVTTIVMRYSGELYAKENYEAIRKLFDVFTKYVLIFGLIIFFLGLAFLKPLANFFSIDHLFPLFIVMIGFVFSFLIVVNRGILQGTQRFLPVSLIGISEMSLRLGIGLLLIKVGLGLNGTVLGVFLATFFAYIISFGFLIKVFRPKHKKSEDFKFDRKEVMKYSLPTVVSTLFLSLFLNIDVILVKHYFPPTEAGLYAAISTIAKIIVYVTGPMATVMFPMISEKRVKGEKHYRVFMLALLLTLVGGLVMEATYFFAPGKIITVLYGDKFSGFFYLLPQVGFMILLYSLVNTLSNYYLSIKSFAFIPVSASIFLAQVIGVVLWHDSLEVVVKILIAGQGLLFVMLMGYYLLTKKAQLLNYFKGLDE